MKDYKKLFPIFQHQPNLVYLDSSATALKPASVIDAAKEYYLESSANSGRGEYAVAAKVDLKYVQLKTAIQEFINAEIPNEIALTSGATFGLNQAIYGIEDLIKKNDEIITDIFEHSSVILPLFRLSNVTKAKIKYLDSKIMKITCKDIEKLITKNTKVICINHVSNLIGHINEVEAIGQMIKEKYPQIIFIVDATQSVCHIPVDVKKMNCDFLAFSAHKMYGPTGIGVLYMKQKWINVCKPLILGGGMFLRLDHEKQTFVTPLGCTSKFEAGTLPLAQMYGFHAAIEFLNKMSKEVIFKHEQELYKYAYAEMLKLPDIKILNPNADLGIIAFVHKTIFCQDLATQLSLKNICVRSGQHCVKLSYINNNEINSTRISLQIYNTKKDIDTLIDGLKNLGDGLDAFF